MRAIHRYGGRPALVWQDKSLTYHEMGQLISQIIQALKFLGLKSGDGIAQLAGNRAETICVTIAANIIGLRYTPLHPLGSLDDHIFILNDAEVSTVVVDQEKFGESCTSFLVQVSKLTHLLTMGDGDVGTDLFSLMAEFEPAPLVIEAQAEDIAWIAYTGGTTGKPKGVVLPHRSLVTNILMALSDWEWPADIRFLAVTPVSHATGVMVPSIFQRGGVIHLDEGFSPAGFLKAVQQHKITATFMVPTMIYGLLDCENLDNYDFSSMETVIYGAAAISPTRLQKALGKFGPIFMQLFGQTEAPNTICVLKKSDHDPENLDRLSSCGIPIVGNLVSLLGDDGSEVTRGDVGEICVRGPLIMDGYWHREEETSAALENGWLHTGDMARQDEKGFLYIVDRKKDLIISGGFNVFPREIEDVLSTHPSVSAVSVYGVPDDKWGEAVCAAIVLQPGEKLSVHEVKALVKDRKGAIHTPKQIKFMEALPVTALGKPDKKALRILSIGIN